jgi:hypothetical protein
VPTRLSPEELEQQIAHRLAGLHRELGPTVPTHRLTTLGRYHTDRLLAQATITDYIPLLAYRATREDLLHHTNHTDTIPAAA